MSASEALTIWMLSTAMKAPSVAPATAIQVLADTAGSAGAATRLLSKSAEGAALRAGCSVVMAMSSRSGGGGVHQGQSAEDGALEATRCAASRAAIAADLVLTVGSADMPGRNKPFRLLSSNTIFTGTRCTILVKLPVALSGGSSANSRPLAGDRLSTWPFSRAP